MCIRDSDNEGYRLSDLITNIEKLSEIKRVRYTTSHPKDMTDDLIEVYKTSNKLMPLVHLPVQSGSNRILKLMNRKHTIEEYLNTFDRLKEINSRIQFSSDFIIAYPGEENQDFENTFNLIERVKFINSYSFIFSPRPGTVAENLHLIDKKKVDKIKDVVFIKGDFTEQSSKLAIRKFFKSNIDYFNNYHDRSCKCFIRFSLWY